MASSAAAAASSSSQLATASVVFLLAILVLLLHHPQQEASAAPAPAPGPSGPPGWYNITQVLVSAGYLNTFVELVATQTDVAARWQSFVNASNTTGATIFAPLDSAFQDPQLQPLLANISIQNLTTLLLYHSLPIFHSYKELQLSSFPSSPTFASARTSLFLLDITNQAGSVSVQSSITVAHVSSNYYNEFPLSVFAIDQILLPVEIFGDNVTITPPPSPSPAPSPSPSLSVSLPSAPSTPSAPSPSAAVPSPPHPHFGLLLLLLPLFAFRL